MGQGLFGEAPRSHSDTTVGRTTLDLYLTTHNTHNRHPSMLLMGFEPTIPASKWQHTHALDCAASGISTGTM